MHEVGAVVHGLIDGLLVHQVELGHGEDAHQHQREQGESVEHAAHAVQSVEEEECLDKTKQKRNFTFQIQAHACSCCTTTYKARGENVVPENDRLDLVDHLVDVTLEPVSKLLHALLWQGEVGGGQFAEKKTRQKVREKKFTSWRLLLDPRVIVAAKDAIVQGQVEAIGAHHRERGEHEEAKDAEEGERGERDESDESREEHNARLLGVLPENQLLDLWRNIHEVEPV